MPADNPRISPSQTSGISVPTPRQQAPDSSPALVDVPRRPRESSQRDPYDLSAALARLALLLEAEENQPINYVPRGYYIDILV